MQPSEMFLIGWCVIATALAVMYRFVFKKLIAKHTTILVLLAEVTDGVVKPKHEGGFTIVENDNVKLKYKRKGS